MRPSEFLLKAAREQLNQRRRPTADGQPDRTTRRAGRPPRPRERLGEDALQTYFRRRLFDGLRRIVDGAEITPPLREDQVARRRRLDLRVTAPCRGHQSIATVVVEIKWSDNRELRTGLTRQVGEDYLLVEGLCHGVYLVGWTGQWYPGDRHGADCDIDGLRRFLGNQRDAFCNTGQPGHGLRIADVVIDLRWTL
jgi:hypothetical protein